MYSVDRIGQFLERYRAFAQEASDLRLHSLTARFGHVRTALEALADLDRRYQRQIAPRFNLFGVLRLDRYEVRTHSAFLTHLFRPNGAHGQGILFLDTFLQYCLGKGHQFDRFPRIDLPTEGASWDVVAEKSVPGGQLDIVIESRRSNLLMVVENKIDAPEQMDQLGRYQDWLSRRSNYPPDRRVLIYLTPDGRRATTASREDYFCLSYARDVSAWLKSALPGIEASRVRDAVIQYLDLIGNLFHFVAEAET